MKSAPVPGHPDYTAFEDGSIFSSKSRKALSPLVTRNGYRHVALDGKRQFVHRIMASAFFGEIPERHVVHHMNNVKSDNRLENLQVISQSENVKRAYADGQRVISKEHRDRCASLGSAKRSLTVDQVAEMRASHTSRRGSLAALARKYGLNHKTARAILAGKTYREG